MIRKYFDTKKHWLKFVFPKHNQSKKLVKKRLNKNVLFQKPWALKKERAKQNLVHLNFRTNKFVVRPTKF